MLRTPPILPICLAALLLPGRLGAQPAPTRDAAALQALLDRLQVLGTALYVAAHPDDENTAVLAALAQGAKVRTVYLALTRGGGGQNLVGAERGEPLAALRTQELLAARRLDGAEQRFTRCVDFGFSKTPAETLRLWNRQAALADVVWAVRSLRPDVVITRFRPDQTGTHGHHTASAILAVEAFKAAADPAAFPEQLATVSPWRARRVLWNAWRAPDDPGPVPAGGLVLDVGRYDPLLGRSYQELAAESRSQHRSQGFGAVPVRGARLERFELLAGEPAQRDLFEGVDLTWNRVPGGEALRPLLAKARDAYRPERPEAALPWLLQAKRVLDGLPSEPLVEVKRAELLEAIRCAAGIWVEAIAARPEAAPGDAVPVTVLALARGTARIQFLGASVAAAGDLPGRPLLPNQPVQAELNLRVPADARCSQPSWTGAGVAPPGALAGTAEDPPAFTARFRFAAEGVPFELVAPVQHRRRDPVEGERYLPFVVVPPVMVNPAEPAAILGDPGSRGLALEVRAGKGPVAGLLKLAAPPGWRVEPSEIPFRLARQGDTVKVAATVVPPDRPGTGALEIATVIEGVAAPALGRVAVDHPHVPPTLLFPPARVRLVRMQFRREGGRIGYVMGAGDGIPEALRPLGYEVDLLGDADLAGADLSRFDAIVVGIRAFNTRPALAALNHRLLDYVAAGGTEVVLYAGDQGLVTPDLGPFPLTVGRDRVAEEDAPVRLLDPDQPPLDWPNRIGPADFEGWVQERGLSFARAWDPRYRPVLAMADQGEPQLQGGLLVARHGKGHFVYTGLSFFRQLPEGVPGAYRLFANLLALGVPR